MLEDVVPVDLNWIERALDSWDCTLRWSLLGLTPSVQHVSHLLWQGVAMQQKVRRERATPAALLQLANIDLLHGFAELALLADGQEFDLVRAGLADFLTRAFREFPIRKVCVTAVPMDVDVSAYMGQKLQPVGRLERHVRRGENQFVDVELFELWKENLS
jgi:hypothetical protein